MDLDDLISSVFNLLISSRTFSLLVFDKGFDVGLDFCARPNKLRPNLLLMDIQRLVRGLNILVGGHSFSSLFLRIRLPIFL
jgi:hypothetical protein